VLSDPTLTTSTAPNGNHIATNEAVEKAFTEGSLPSGSWRPSSKSDERNDTGTKKKERLVGHENLGGLIHPSLHLERLRRACQKLAGRLETLLEVTPLEKKLGRLEGQEDTTVLGLGQNESQ